MLKNFFLIFSAVIIFISANAALASNYNYPELTSEGDLYYFEWTSNLFDAIEKKYSKWFSPHQDTYKEFNSSTSETCYYREYDNNRKLAVCVANFKHEVYFVFSDKWHYVGELDKVDAEHCQGACKPDYYVEIYKYHDDL